jgi:uncharacterized membrane protein YedE/YeeE
MIAERCAWYVAGPILGLLIIGLRAFLNKPFGALGGYIDFAENSMAPGRLGFRAYLLVGLILGGALHAISVGSFVPSLNYAAAGGALTQDDPTRFAALLIAGAVMGFGARTAGGCTSGHGMCGMSLGSRASIVASMTFFLTAVTLANGIQWLGVVR